jgi:hypothetical protein
LRYLFQRIVHNQNRWVGPSSGRLGSSIDGGYLNETGFAHEDWNFSKDVGSDGYLHGYMYFRPKDSEGEFNILFAIYDKGEGWALAGYYERASHDAAGAEFPNSVLERRASELERIGSLGGDYAGAGRARIAALLRREAKEYRWRVRPQNAHLMQTPLRLPLRIANVPGKYFTRPTEIDKRDFDAIIAFARNYTDRAPMDDYSGGGDTEFPEGKSYQAKHFARERNARLVAQAKALFRQEHGRLFCEACRFDFHKIYGEVGDGFIELHHLRPVSEMKSGEKTKLKDVALVCSNCHRMLHRRRPWMTIDALRKLLREPV